MGSRTAKKGKHGREIADSLDKKAFDTDIDIDIDTLGHQDCDTDTDTNITKGANIADTADSTATATATITDTHEVLSLPSIPTPTNQHDAMILAFIVSVQRTLHDQGNTIRELALDNADLRRNQTDLCKHGDEIWQLAKEHEKLKNTITMQATKIAHLEATLEGCTRDAHALNVIINEAMESRNACKHDVEELKNRMLMREKTHVDALEDIKKTMSQMQDVCAPKTWATRVMEKPSTPNAAPMRIAMQEDNPDHVDMEEWREREKRAKNIVIRGLPEKSNESPPTLATDLEEFFRMHFDMSDIKVYGAHRVGKPGARTTGRAIVCSMIDDTKRNILIGNSRFYLKGTSFSICEDQTPKQQEACRKAYDERMAKNKSPPEEEKNTHNT